MQEFDVIIIGASFSGLTCAKKLAEAGVSVMILERKINSLATMHTTGILPMEALAVCKIPQDFLYPINKVCLYHKLNSNLKTLPLHDDKYTFYGTKTNQVINFLADEAIQKGVTIKYDTPFKQGDICKSTKAIIVNNEYKSKFLIGADGACSKVAKTFGLDKNYAFLRGQEWHIKGLEKSLNDTMHVFLGDKLAKGYLAWATPNDGYAQVGLAVKNPALPDIKYFMEEYIKPLFPDADYEITEKIAGVIPINGTLKNIANERVILLGDAAGMVSPLTAGGIHRCFEYSQKLGVWIADYLQNNGEHPAIYAQKHYPKFYKKQFQRWIFDNFANDRLMHIAFSTPMFSHFAKKIFFK